MGALYGSETVVLSKDAPEQARLSRTWDGFWIRGSEVRGTRISAVLVGDAITPWTAGGPLPRLWIHPEAARPLPATLPLPSARVDKSGRIALFEGGMGRDVSAWVTHGQGQSRRSAGKTLMPRTRTA